MMGDFNFDLQRFGGVWKIDNETYSTLAEALAAITGSATITLTADTSETVNGTIPDGVTVDLSNYTFTVLDGNLTLADGVTWQNGTFIISGGTFTGNFNVNESATLSISGGTFDTDVSSYIAENFYLYQDGDSYTVAEAPVVDYKPANDDGNPYVNYYSVSNNGNSYTLGSSTDTVSLSIGDETITISGGTTNSIAVSVATVSGSSIAVVSLDNKNKEFFLNNVRYQFSSGDGLVFSIGSGSAVTVDKINSGDVFKIGNSNNFSMTTDLGLLGSSDDSTPDKMIWDTNISSVAFTGTTPSDLSNWYKLIEADGDAVKIDDVSYFDSSGYKGILIADTDSNSQKVYAQLSNTNVTSSPYMISSIDGGTGNLSSITLTGGVASVGVILTENFAGNNAASITAEKATFQVKQASNYFIVSGNENSPVSLDSAAQAISLINGTLNTAVNTQSIAAGSYTLTGYKANGNANDGIIISTSSNSTSMSLNDLEIGEQFSLSDGTTLSGTYRLTKVGLASIVDNKEILLTKNTNSTVPFAVDGVVAASDILKASTLTGYIDATDDIITISSGTGSSLISYNNQALATLKTANKAASLTTDSDASDLNPGAWPGVYVASGVTTLCVDEEFTGNTPLKIQTSAATFGLGALSSDDAVQFTIGSDVQEFSNKFNGKVSGVSLLGGTIKSHNGIVTLAGASNITVQNAGGDGISISSSSSRTTIRNSGETSGNTWTNIGRACSIHSYYLPSTRAITVGSDGSTSINLAKGDATNANFNLTLTAGTNETMVVNCPNSNTLKSASTVTFIYGKTSGESVTGLDSGDIFTVTESKKNTETNTTTSTTTTYEVVEDRLSRKNSDGSEELWNGGSISSNAVVVSLDQSDSNFTKILRVPDGNFTLNADSLPSMSVNEKIALVDKTSLTRIYGYLTKKTSESFILTKGGDNTPLSSVTITGNLTVEFDNSFKGITINVTGSGKNATFVSEAGDSFTLNSSATDKFYVNGIDSISLVDGTLWSNTKGQSIMSGDYTVALGSSATGDAIYYAVSGGSYIVGDLNENEAFSVKYSDYNDLYTYQKYPTGLTTNGSIYSGEGYLSPGLVENATLAVNLAHLTKRGENAPFGPMLAATNGVFSIGSGSNTITGVVVDSTSSPTARYAQLNKNDRNYELTTLQGANEWASTVADSIAIAEVTASINTNLATDTGKTIFVGKTGATFKVTASDGDTFVVNGSSNVTTVLNATKITLLGGKITATQGQTITLGEENNAVDFVVSSSENGMAITYDSTGKSFTINGKVGDEFKIGDSGEQKEYAVVNGDGMNFIVDSSGKVTVNGLTSNKSDVFSYDGATYSLRSAGLVKTSDSYSSLWSNNNAHSLSNESVAISDLETDNYWISLATVSGGVATILPDSRDTTSAIFLDENFKQIYGELTVKSSENNIYSLSKANETTNKLSGVNITSGVGGLYMDSYYASNTFSLMSSNTTVKVQTLVDNAEDYLVTLYSGAMGLSGVKKAELVNGSFVLDSNLSNDDITVHFDNRYIKAGDSTTITLSGSYNDIINDHNITITGLDEGETFSISGSRAVTLGSLGLTNEKQQLLNRDQFKPSGNGNESIEVSTIMGGDWRGFIYPQDSVLSISKSNTDSVFVVDSANPTVIYATLTPVTDSGLSLTADSNDAWPSSDSIEVDSTTVTISSAFRDKTIMGKNSNVAFTISDTVNFVLKDSTVGASIWGLDSSSTFTINQTRGTITTSNTNETIRANDYSIAYSGGDGIKVIVDPDSTVAASIAALNKGDIFKVNGGEALTYSVSGAGLINTTENKIWKDATSNSVIAVDTTDGGLTNSANWSYFINVENGALSIPPSQYASENSWVILNEDRTKRYGTLSLTGGNSYSIIKDGSWDSDDTISVNEVAVSLSVGFKAVPFKGVASGAEFKITEGETAFTVTDGVNGASIGTATQILQTGGTIALTKDFQQTVSAIDSTKKISVPTDSKGDGITVIVNGNSASVGALSITDSVDSFAVNGKNYEMLPNGSIRRESDKKYWIGSTVTDGGAVNISSLLTDDVAHWIGYITISGGALTIDGNDLKADTPVFVIDETDATKIFGKLSKDSAGVYTLDYSSANSLPSSITFSTKAQPVSLTTEYCDISLNAGDTQFKVTTATSGFTVNYSSTDSLSVSNATGLELLKGAWTLTNTNQTLTANDQTVQLNSSGGAVTVNYDGSSNDVNITGIDAADETVLINKETYKLNSTGTDGDGISVKVVKDGDTTVNDIDNDDNFKYGSNNFIKKSAGFIKTNGSSYLWTGDAASVTSGLPTTVLSGTTDWTGVATVANGNLTINNDSATAILIDSTDNLSAIYGTLTKNAAKDYTLTDDNNNDVELSSITVDKVSATISEDFAGISINALGASFSVTSLTSGGSSFTVNATNSHAVIGNVTEVSLGSGTLGSLKAGTNVKTEVNSETKTIAAQDNSAINVNLTGSEITISDLANGENFKLNDDTYTYKNVGVVKGTSEPYTLFVNNSLGGSITVASLEGGNFRTMIKSDDGKTLVLQPDEQSVSFVDDASTSVSKVYATQDYSDGNYTFATVSGSNHTIDAAALTSDSSITAEFKSTIKTPASGTYTINGRPYTAVTELNVSTLADQSSLAGGTVLLDMNGSTSVAVTKAENDIVLTSGDGIQVTASISGGYTLGELNEGDIFKIGDYTYEMKSDVAIVRTGTSGNEEIYIEKVADKSLKQGVIESTNWKSFVTLDDTELNLSKTVGGGIVVSEDFAKMYASLTSDSGSFTLKTLDKDDTAEITSINLANEDSTLKTDFNATINTASGSSIYRINNKSYTAKGSELEIAATVDSLTSSTTSTITKGTITLNNSTVATTSNHTISGAVDELTVDSATLTFKPATSEKFTLDAVSYEMTKVGLTKGGTSIWTEDVEEYTLPSDDSSWSMMMKLASGGTSNGVLNLSGNVAEGNTIVIDTAAENRMASLDYSTNNYKLTALNGNEIATVQFGNSTDTVTVTVDFNSMIAINSGTYKVNGDTYKGNSLQVKTAEYSSSFYGGTASLSSDDSITDTSGNNIKVTSGDIIVTASGGTIQTLGNLTSGDTFTIGNNKYKVLDSQTLVQLDANDEPYKLYTQEISGNSAEYSNIVNASYYSDFIPLSDDGVLDLTAQRGSDGWSAIVLAKDTNGDYTTRIATVNYSNESGYELEDLNGNYSQIKSVELSVVKKFSSGFDTTINTKANGEYTINGSIFNARANLEIVTEDGNAILTSGSVTVAEGETYAITTRRTSGTTNTDEKIQATSGSIIVTVDETTTPGTVTISGLAAGEKFKVDDTEYTMTKIGLLNGSSQLNTSVAGSTSITTAALSGDGWQSILSITNDTLTLNSSTASNVLVVDISELTKEIKYGTLTKSSSENVYTLTQDSDDSQLKTININGTTAIFGTKAVGVDIVANDNATFSVTSTDSTNTFTVNAASTNPTVTNAAAISLSAGTMNATLNIPILANGKTTVTATKGDMTVGVNADKTAVVVGSLNPTDEETFTADNVNYKITRAGLLNVTDSSNYYIITSGVSDDLTTFTINSDITSEKIIAVNGTNLDLAQENSSALVYDSKTAPTKKLATYTYDNSGKKTLKGESTAATAILTVGIAAGDDLTVTDFATQVESSGAGLVTVNTKNYSGTTALKIKAAADGTTSTFYDGTITLNETYGSATDSNSNTLTRDSGSFSATAKDGKFTTVSGLANEGQFTYGGTTYIQAAPGLINSTKDLICPDVLAGATITLSSLNTLDWNEFRAPVSGVLDISDISKKTIIYDSETAPTTQLATLTVGSGKKTLAGVEVASSYIDTINIAVGDDLTITDFAAQVASPDKGLITVNTKIFNGTTALTVDAAADGVNSALYEGTITLDRTYSSATDARGTTLSRDSGTFDAAAANGKFTTLTGLDAQESFIYNGETYTQSVQGLRKGALIRTDLSPALIGTTLDLDTLSAGWDNMLAPTNGVLDISSFNDDAYVYNDATNPTEQLATLTYANGKKTLKNYEGKASAITTVKIGAGDDLTVDFATNVNAAIGTVTVNSNPYVGTTELLISAAADGTTSTLTNGTVSLTGKDDSVTTTGGAAITYKTENGDGMTVAVNGSGTTEVVTFNGLTLGDVFTIGSTSYKVSAVGPINSDGKIWSGSDYTEGITLTALNTESNWSPMLTVAADESLSVNADTFADGVKSTVVDNVDNPTKIYGELTKTSGTYSLTKPSYANGTLTAFKASGTTVEIAPEFAGVKIVANDSNEYTNTALKDAEKSFTLNTTGANPSLSDNVSSLTLAAGAIAATANQTVTASGTAITPTAIKGSMAINLSTIGGIVTGDEFKLGDKAYKMLTTGLFNDTDNKLVTTGMDGDTLTFGGMAETQLIAVDAAGALDLTKAAAGDSLVVDTVESPANIYGKLGKNENTYTLDKQGTADGIKSVTMPDADSTLTTDVAAVVNTPSGSHKFTVNSKAYTASDSALVINSDGTTSTLTNGTIALANNNDAVTTTGGIEITYTASGDGMTVTATANGVETVKVGGLTAGDTFKVGSDSYRVSEAGPMNSSGEIWTSTADYTAGLTIASTGTDGISNPDNWTPLLAATNGNLLINTRTFDNGGKFAVVDDINNPTKIYGYLTRTDDKYSLTKPSYVNGELNSITVSNTIVEFAPEFAGINLTANDSAFSDTTINDATQTFTLNASGETPILSDNIKSLTLTAGTILADTDQSVTVNGTTIKPSTIKGTMIIGMDKISGIVEGDRFTLGDKAYKMLNTGLFNDTDDSLVTEGMEQGALTFANIVETKLIAVDSAGALDLSRVSASDTIVVDSVENPANIYGKISKNEETYTLNEQGTAGGIKSVTMPDADSTLTTDIATVINAASSSHKFTVNGKAYTASNSALVINSDGATSTLTNGTVSLTSNNDNVTTTSGSTVTYTTGTGDGMTVAATISGTVTLDGLTAGDKFKVGDDSYKVTALGFHNDDDDLWTGRADYRTGVTVSSTGSNGINNANNWTKTVAADNDELSVRANTLSDGDTAIVIDSADNSTKTLGTLTKDGDTYTLDKGSSDAKLAGISVINTTMVIDQELADVPVTADGATFTVTALEPFTVDSTGEVATISEDASAIELSAGTIAATTNQTVTATADSGNTYVAAQDNGTFSIGGKDFIVTGNEDDITFGMTNGTPTSVAGLEADATVTIDNITYTAPQDNSTLKFTDADGWYFDGYVPDKYNITVDTSGNITLDPGVKFTNVISSGRTLTEDNTIKLVADVNRVAVNLTNGGTAAIDIISRIGTPLAENLGTVSNVTFDSAGVMVENTADVAGAVFTLDNGKSFETETATVTSNASNCAVGIGSDGKSLSVDKAATIDAPANTELTLSNANYTVKGVDFRANGTAQASITSGGVKLDLVKSDSFTYDGTNLNGTGTAKATIEQEGRVSLTSGASLNSASGRILNIAGTVTLDANTVNAATATNVTAKANGLAVGNDDVTITGDDDGYKVDIERGIITGFENIGNADGVTLGGLANGTVKTDKVGSFTVAGRTFLAVDDPSVIYGIKDGKVVYVDDVESIMSGDFTDGVTVNGGKLQVTGAEVSISADTTDNRTISGFGDSSTLTTAEGVEKVEPNGAGRFTFGEHVFETDDPSIAFNLVDNSVTGIDSLEGGKLIISQDEFNFGINGKNLTLTDLAAPVTLDVEDSLISAVYGLDGNISGLENATLYDVGTATINGKKLDIDGSDYTATVVDGALANIYGLENGATVNAAQDIKLRTRQNGTFTFRDDEYTINDTLDGVVVFTTNENSYVTNIGELNGSVSGGFEDLTLNDKPFDSNNDNLTVATDGEEITGIYGLLNGDTVTGSVSSATYLMPKGTLTVNDQEFILKGDDDGVSISGDGKVILGLDRDASLTIAIGGDYSVNGNTFDDAEDGTTFIAGRNKVFKYDPNSTHIGEKTEPNDIIENLIGKLPAGAVSLSGDSAASVIASGNLDSPMALTLDNSGSNSVQTADFSESRYSKRVTLLGGDQDVKFNDEGGNAAYVDPEAIGNKNIELGDGDDVAVNDSPYAKVSIKAGKGEDTIINRNDASTTVDVKSNGDTTIVPTSGRVTLTNYDNKNNAKIRTYEYDDLSAAVKDNSIKFGDGNMTLGDAVVVFDPDAKEVGGTFANLVNYEGDEQRVGFTHSAGGILNASTSSDDLVMKGGYREDSSDPKKTGASTLIGGKGDDTLLAGEGDLVRAGGGDNQIYVTDKNLRGTDGATIVLTDKGRNTIHGFNGGYENADEIQVKKASALEFIYGEDGLVMRSGNAYLTFDSLEPAEQLVTYDDNETAAPYELKIIEGKKEYNVAVAQEGMDIGVDEFSEANVFFGEKNSGSGVNFSEYSGPIEVNLGGGTGTLNGTAAQFFNINKAQAGREDATLVGAPGKRNTLIAGTGSTSIWSAAGKDLMVGSADSEDKDGVTTFFYTNNDGRDTITNFAFITSVNDYNADIISLPGGNVVSDVYMRNGNVIMGINGNANDYLVLQGAVGQDFKINDRIAQVNTNGEFDNLADFFVVTAHNATMNVGANIGDAQIWLEDHATNEHGVIYHGEIKYLNASTANGNTTLVGNDLDNVIYGGTASNSIWGGYGMSKDTLVGGSGQNTFFFGYNNGNDVITSVRAGDVVDLSSIALEEIAGTTVTADGTKIELIDGSSLEVQGNAADVEYRLIDGSKYTADHGAGRWNKK